MRNPSVVRDKRRRNHSPLLLVLLLLLPMLHFTCAWKYKEFVGRGSTFESAKAVTTFSSSSSSTLFFDPNLAASALEVSNYEELPPITFGPTGRLYVVEAAFKASQLVVPRSNVVLAMKCKDGLVLLTTMATSALLNTTSVVTLLT